MRKFQKIEYMFELNDMFLFRQNVGCYNKGDYIIISEISGNTLYFTTNDTVKGSCQTASGDSEWVSGMLNDGSISYEGTLVKPVV